MNERDNSGVLFKNDRKESDRHPDYTGRATIDGVEFWLSAWIKEGARGKFMSLAFKPKEEKQQPAPERQRIARPSMKDELSDEIPF